MSKPKELFKICVTGTFFDLNFNSLTKAKLNKQLNLIKKIHHEELNRKRELRGFRISDYYLKINIEKI